MMKIDVIIEGLDWESREDFNYDAFREALQNVGIDVDSIRFVQ